MSQSGQKNTQEKLGLLALTAITISSMIGSGVDGLPQNMSIHSEVGPIILAWIITGFGMFFIAKTFITLSDARPDLQSGIYMYAHEGFGDFAAFIVAWGYWLMTMFSNVAFAIMVMDVLNYFIPGDFKGGNNLNSIIGASILIWGFNFLVLSGTKSVGILNAVGTIAKLIPLCIFVIIVLYFFNSAEFLTDFWGDSTKNTQQSLGPISGQVLAPLDVALWCFIGIESAVALSARARNKKDVGRATLIGFIISLIICILVSILPFGVLSRAELSILETPSTAGVIQKITGNWGEILINVGVLISILSSWLAWTMICAEIPMVAAKNGTFPKIFAKLNSKKSAAGSLWISSAIKQIILIFIFFANNAWLTMLSISAVTVLPAYFASAAYLLKISLTGDLKKYSTRNRFWAGFAGMIGIIFCLFMAYASGFKYAIMAPLFITIGIPIYIWTVKKEQKASRLFNKQEWGYFLILLLLDAIGLYYHFVIN